MKSGDIYAYKTLNGYYSAIRVLKVDPKGEEKLFFFLTSYYEKKIPQLNDEKLYIPYDEYSVQWVENIDVGELIYIGYKPLNEWESKRHLKTNIAFGQSLFGSINVPYYRWLAKNDPAAFELLLEEDRKAEEQQNKAERSLPNKAFWEIIQLIQPSADDPLKEARTKLAGFTEKQIRQFEEALAHKLYKLDTKKHAREIGEQAYRGVEDYFSADFFLYVRCLCVGRGQEFYEKVLKQPNLIPKDEDFEELLSLSSEAYEEKTGEEFDYIPSKNYETFSNTKGWK